MDQDTQLRRKLKAPDVILLCLRSVAGLGLLAVVPSYPAVPRPDELSSQSRTISKVAPPNPKSHDNSPELSVLHSEGLVHGFLRLTSLSGEVLADGELKQSANGDRVTSDLLFRFKDGSVHEEVVVFSQRRRFRLLSYRLVQKGPAFKNSINAKLDGLTGKISIEYSEEDHKAKNYSENLKLPTNLANGMLPILLKNIGSRESGSLLNYVALTPKPRIVKLAISADGEEPFYFGNSVLQTTRYAVKFELGGIAGVVAPIVGKRPEDTNVWILRGDTPAFIKSEGPLFAGGPSWRIELASPQYQKK
jgi:hypothetical protein